MGTGTARPGDPDTRGTGTPVPRGPGTGTPVFLHVFAWTAICMLACIAQLAASVSPSSPPPAPRSASLPPHLHQTHRHTPPGEPASLW